MAVLPPDPVYNLRCPSMGPVNSICFHSNDQLLLAGNVKGQIFLWDLQTNRSSLNFRATGPEEGSMNCSTTPVTDIYHTGNHLITQLKGGELTLWAEAEGGYVKLYSISGKYMGFCRTSLLPKCSSSAEKLDDISNKDFQKKETDNGNNLLIYPCDEQEIGIWDVNRLPPQESCRKLSLKLLDDNRLNVPPLGALTCLKSFRLSDRSYVLAGYESGHFVTWDLDSSRPIDCHQLETESLLAVDYDVFTNRGIAGGPYNHLTAFSYQRNEMHLKTSNSISKLTLKNPGTNVIRIRPDFKVFASGGWDGRVRVYSWKSLRPLAVLTEHKNGAITDITFSKSKVERWNAPIMAVSGMDGVISLWDLYN